LWKNRFQYLSVYLYLVELRTTQENLKDENIYFNYKIELTNVGFHYQEKTVLSDINLTINKGEKIAFIGESGSGKSTLVNLIIGLHQQNQGEIKIDDIVLDEFNLQNWRSQIGYIPQQVYLFDGTIADNICFGRKLEDALLEKVLKQANILFYFD
jgi:ABC-type multidrug transport system fused ATPase/permease subunit